jgi:uncharacterized protein (DUF4415 family)
MYISFMKQKVMRAALINGQPHEEGADGNFYPITDEQWQQAIKIIRKSYIHLGLDADVLAWFKSRQKRGYQTLINAVLRQYMEEHRKG